MGFTKPKHIYFDKITKKLNYPNPDGLDINWCYKLSNGEIICPLFIRDTFNFRKVGVKLKYEGNGTYSTITKNKYPVMTDLNDIPEYKNKFNTNSNYHPNEITADIISEYMVNNIDIPQYINLFIQKMLK